MNYTENGPATSAEVTQCKVPYKRIKYAVKQIVELAFPLHLQLLKEKCDSIELLKCKSSLSSLRAEHLDARKCVKLLKADLYELEQLYSRVEDKDQDIFCNATRKSLEEVVEAISRFTELYPDADEPIPNISFSDKPEFPQLICHLDQECEPPAEDQQIVRACLTLTSCDVDEHTSTSSFPDWSFLRKEILEVHSLITKFASYVFAHGERVNTIQNNVEQAHENVQEGVHHLKKASLLKASVFPLFGAIAGGLVLGPVGFAVGLKLGTASTAACAAAAASGGLIGYKTGMTLKKKHEISADIEMKALTYTSKEKSSSNPELSTKNN